jgi:hypothetical protein
MPTSVVDKAMHPHAARMPYPLPVGVVVSREAQPVHAACALCWVGPSALPGAVRERAAMDSPPRFICGRCLVTLEMLAAQFGSDLRLQVETPSRPYRSSATQEGCASA